MIKKRILNWPEHLNKQDRGAAINPSDLLKVMPQLSDEAAWGLFEFINQLAYVIQNHFEDQINRHLCEHGFDPEPPPDNDWFDDDDPPF